MLNKLTVSQQTSGIEGGAQTEVLTKVRTETVKPPLYKVILLNDDYSPMDFVVYVLKTIFHKEHTEAIRIMLQIHHQGSGICGVFTRDVAETKVELVSAFARKNDHPLKCVMERE